MRKRSGGSQLHRLAVDAGGHGVVGVDLERGRGPLAPRPLRQAPAAAAADRAARDGDPEQPVVDARAGAGADRAAEPVAVVGDEDRGSRVVLVPAGAASSAGRARAPSGPSTSGTVSSSVRSFASR